jgi:hypothetical protein
MNECYLKHAGQEQKYYNTNKAILTDSGYQPPHKLPTGTPNTHVKAYYRAIFSLIRVYSAWLIA